MRVRCTALSRRGSPLAAASGLDLVSDPHRTGVLPWSTLGPDASHGHMRALPEVLQGALIAPGWWSARVWSHSEPSGSRMANWEYRLPSPGGLDKGGRHIRPYNETWLHLLLLCAVPPQV
jgi:hypothetical protein